MKQALKEWDAQVRALEAGSVALIVRKGGITERKNDFEVEHKQFLRYTVSLKSLKVLASSNHQGLRETVCFLCTCLARKIAPDGLLALVQFNSLK